MLTVVREFALGHHRYSEGDEVAETIFDGPEQCARMRELGYVADQPSAGPAPVFASTEPVVAVLTQTEAGPVVSPAPVVADPIAPVAAPETPAPAV